MTTPVQQRKNYERAVSYEYLHRPLPNFPPCGPDQNRKYSMDDMGQGLQESKFTHRTDQADLDNLDHLQ